MKDNVAETFEKIEKFIRNGQLLMAKKELASFSKSKKLSPLERVRLAMFHLRLGQGSKAIRCISKELGPNEFSHATPEELCEQAILAHILNQMGAQNYALRLIARIAEVAKAQEINLVEVLPELSRYIGNIYFGSYNYQLALPFYEQVLKQIGDPGSYRYKLTKIGVADALEGMGKADEAIKICTDILSVTNDDQKLIKAISHQARGEYYFRRGLQGDNQRARRDFDDAAKLFDPKTDTKDFAFLNKWSGILRMKENNFPAALEELQKSKDVLMAANSRPTTFFEVFYWLEQLKEYNPPLLDKIALRAHPLPSPFSVVTGKIDGRFTKVSNPWLQRILDKRPIDQNNIWIIKEGQIVPAIYDREIVALCEKHNEIIDLYASAIHQNGKHKTLTENQAKALISVLGSGSLGVSQWSLIDSVYAQSFFDPISGIERINKTIDQLRKNGFAIERKNNHYFFEVEKDKVYILPKDLNPRGVYAHFKVLNHQFKRAVIEETYEIKKATANIWVKEWEELGLIEKFGVGKSSYYQFK